MKYRPNPVPGILEIVAIFVPAIQKQPQEFNQLPVIPEPEQGLPTAGPVKHPSSSPSDVTNHPSLTTLPRQCVPDQAPVGIAVSRPWRNVRPPSRLIEKNNVETLETFKALLYLRECTRIGFKSNEEWSSQLWSQFLQLRKEAWKNSGLQRGLNPWPRNTGATLYQRSYEATDVGSRSILGSYVPVKDMRWMMHMK